MFINKAEVKDMKSILIVDDEVDITEILKQAFEQRKWDVTVAHSVDEALKLHKEINPQVVLSDIRMPGSGGIGIATAIRNMRANRAIVFLMTGFADLSNQPLKNLGVNKVFQKPFDLIQLITEIEDSLTQKAS